MYSNYQYKNTNIRYRSTGKGRAVVLLHGFLENLTMWSQIEAELSKRYRVVSIDLLGHGSSGNLGYVHTMEAQAQMVNWVLKHLRLRKYILIGHSMGGYISLAFADLFPDAVKGICLMNSTAEPDSKEKRINRDRAVEAVKNNFKTFVRIAIPNLFAEANRSIFNKGIDAITDDALQLSPQGIIAALEGMKIRKDKGKVLKHHPSEKLMIIGENDPVLDRQSLIKQAKNSNIKFIELPDGHMSHIENASALKRALKEFVKTCN
ncbi:MAG: alpha/beta hydrolase [Bacteroidia bacterium]|nr:alpha/beta hydrolase [Bacteroidia bacterium]